MKLGRAVVFVVLGTVLLAGCSHRWSTQMNLPPPAAQDVPPPAAPMAHVDDKSLAHFKSQYDLARAAYAKDGNSQTAKDTYVLTTVQYGEAMMDADGLTPHEKYSGALRLFREALKVDPTNAQAKQSKDLIESIYKQMGRPIPN